MNVLARIACVALGLCVFSVQADEEKCRTVRFADIGWTDIAATTGLASVVLSGLGYGPQKTNASVPIALAGLKSGEVDAFLGYWKPAMDAAAGPFVEKGEIQVSAAPNLTGAKFTLAVPAYAYEAGLHDFADIARYADRLDHKIYGIGSGGAGNQAIQKMIDQNRFGLKDFKLVESSEAGMLVQVGRAVRKQQWIVFLGWEPHPMNLQFDMRYLSGGDEAFGPDYGAATVYTMTRAGYAGQCPNAARLLTNLRFDTGMENQLMLSIMDKREKPETAATQWLQAHPDVLETWLANVQTFDGKPALPAVKAALAAVK
jgi:glycine betaine/proline transport system substrate-binding protein